MSAESIKVAVRVRPFNDREKKMKAKLIIKMNGPVTTITNPVTGEEKEFAFDYSYWSHDGFVEEKSGYNKAGDTPSPVRLACVTLPPPPNPPPTQLIATPTMSQTGAPYASQLDCYNNRGRAMLENAWQGYNCCMFAYGQTGSGKSYSFVGYGANEGVLPQARPQLMTPRTHVHVNLRGEFCFGRELQLDRRALRSSSALPTSRPTLTGSKSHAP